MLRNILRVLGALTALFFAFLCTMLVAYDNEFFPLGTTHTFTLSVGNAEKADDVLAGELDNLAREQGLSLYKRETRPSAEGEQNLVAFGQATGRVGEEIAWFDPDIRGFVTSWEGKKNEALSGYFMSEGPTSGYEVLKEWADASRVNFQWEDQRSLKSFIATFTFNNGVGFAAISVLITLLASVIVWYVTKVKSRALRLLAGVRPSRIVTQDMRQLAGLIYLPMWGAWLVCLALVRWRYGSAHISMYVRWSTGLLALASLVLALGVLCIALAGRPRIQSIAERTPSFTAFVYMGWLVRAFGVLVAVVVIPYSVQYVSLAFGGEATVESWTKAREAVTLTMNTLDMTHTEEQGKEHRVRLEAFVRDIGERDDAATSVLLDDYGLPEEVLGAYDGVAVIDSHFLSLMGVQPPSVNTDFKRVDTASLPIALAQEYFRPSQGLVSSYVREGHEKDISLYEYRGNQAIPVVKNLGDAMPFTVDGKLIIYVNDAFETFKLGLLEATITNGQSLFRDADSVRALLTKHSLDPYVAAVRSAANQVTVTAREYRNQAVFGISAGILAVIALLIAVIEAAQVWAATNRRRIFVMHSSGKSLMYIVKIPVIREIVFMTFVGLAAASFSVFALNIGGVAMVAFVGGTVCASSLIAGMAYLASARVEFQRAIKRKD